VRRFLEELDHPLMFAAAMVLIVTAGQRFATWAAKNVGANGVASFFQGA